MSQQLHELLTTFRRQATDTMKPTRILSLDLATVTGWARHANGVTDAGHIAFTRKHGRKTKPDDHEGVVFLRFLRWLNTRILEDKPDVIVYERPAGHFASAAASCMAFGLRSILYCNAAHHGIPVVAYAPTSLKKWATGSGRAEKPAMIARARLLPGGEDITDNNAADALLMLHYHLTK